MNKLLLVALTLFCLSESKWKKTNKQMKKISFDSTQPVSIGQLSLWISNTAFSGKLEDGTVISGTMVNGSLFNISLSNANPDNSGIGVYSPQNKGSSANTATISSATLLSGYFTSGTVGTSKSQSGWLQNATVTAGSFDGSELTSLTIQSGSIFTPLPLFSSQTYLNMTQFKGVLTNNSIFQGIMVNGTLNNINLTAAYPELINTNFGATNNASVYMAYVINGTMDGVPVENGSYLTNTFITNGTIVNGIMTSCNFTSGTQIDKWLGLLILALTANLIKVTYILISLILFQFI